MVSDIATSNGKTAKMHFFRSFSVCPYSTPVLCPHSFCHRDIQPASPAIGLAVTAGNKAGQDLGTLLVAVALCHEPSPFSAETLQSQWGICLFFLLWVAKESYFKARNTCQHPSTAPRADDANMTWREVRLQMRPLQNLSRKTGGSKKEMKCAEEEK